MLYLQGDRYPRLDGKLITELPTGHKRGTECQCAPTERLIYTSQNIGRLGHSARKSDQQRVLLHKRNDN